jgi:hypothetical protein
MISFFIENLFCCILIYFGNTKTTTARTPKAALLPPGAAT